MRRVYEKAIQLAPDAAMLHYNLAMVRKPPMMNLAKAGYKRAAELSRIGRNCIVRWETPCFLPATPQKR